MSNISIELWSDDDPLEMAEFYCSVFNNSKIHDIVRWADDMPGKAGAVMYVRFELNGQQFGAVDGDGGPDFKPSEAVSIMVNCETQEEIDRYWEALSVVPEAEQCGWLKDKFGVSWQIAPSIMQELMTDPDRPRAERALKAMMSMKKFDIEALKRAADSA